MLPPGMSRLEPRSGTGSCGWEGGTGLSEAVGDARAQPSGCRGPLHPPRRWGLPEIRDCPREKVGAKRCSARGNATPAGWDRRGPWGLPGCELAGSSHQMAAGAHICVSCVHGAGMHSAPCPQHLRSLHGAHQNPGAQPGTFPVPAARTRWDRDTVTHWAPKCPAVLGTEYLLPGP